MTKEEKQILIEDLCGILPYPIWGLHRGEDVPLHVMDNSGSYMVLGYNAWFNLDTVPFKPYLRSMLSMTDEERTKIASMAGHFNDLTKAIEVCFACLPIVDYCYSRHLDIHGLIEKELALEAPEGIY